MKVRTFLFILLTMPVLLAMASLFLNNREVLSREVHFWGGANLSVGLTLLIFLLLGAAITTLAGLTREFGTLLSRRRARRESRRAEEIEEEYARGLGAVLEGREDDALRHFRGVLERDSRHFNTLLKLGEVLRHQGRHADAIEYHRKAHHLKEEDTRPLYALVEDYEAKGDLDRARAVLGKIIGINKQSLSAWRKLRALHMKEKNWEKALQAHERVEKHARATEPDRGFGIGIRFEMASERLRAGRTKEAIAEFRKLQKEAPRFVPAHVFLGEALAEDGLEPDALQAWYSGFEATGSAVFLSVLEEYFLQRDRPDAAIDALKRCVAMSRKDTLPRFYLGKLYFRLEMLDDALATLSALEGRASYAPALHYLLGRVHERRKNFRDSASEYRKVIREMDLVHLEYRCRSCGNTSVDWSERCANCGEWNCIEVNFREESSADELGLSAAPVYTARADDDE